jgi:hypothetical protein
MDNDLREEIEKLKKDLAALNEEVYKNNFSTFQEFNKRSSFTVSLKVPSYRTVPEVAEVGEIIEVNGKLYICSAINTWSLVGTQV